MLLKKALAAKSDLRVAAFDLGVAYMQKIYGGAEAALKRAVELDPAQPDAHYRLARVYQAMGKSAEAKKEFAEVNRLHRKEDEPLASKIQETPPPLPK